jgi:hypothetical protein
MAKSETGPTPARPREGGTQPGWPTYMRRVLAVLLLIGLLFIVARSSLASEPQVCEEQLAQVGTQPITRSCRPVQLTDPPFLLGLLLILALVLPDFSKVEIGGLLSLERRLQMQEERQTGLEKQLQDLNLRILQQVSQRTTVNVGRDIIEPDEDLRPLTRGLDEKAREFLDESDG